MEKVIYRTEFNKMLKYDLARPIEGYNKMYYVTRDGCILSLISYMNTGKIKVLNGYKRKNGYVDINLYLQDKPKSYRVHRLVAQAFIPNPNNFPVINHKDEVKHNNHVSNLEWCTDKYNLNYGKCQITKSKRVVQSDIFNNKIREWKSISEAEKHGYGGDYISKCARGLQKLYKRCRWSFI